jgi:hypothetical protein
MINHQTIKLVCSLKIHRANCFYAVKVSFYLARVVRGFPPLAAEIGPKDQHNQADVEQSHNLQLIILKYLLWLQRFVPRVRITKQI